MKNAELKALLKEAMNLVAVGKAVVAKNWSGLFSALIPVGVDIPPIVSGWATLKPELKALLADPSSDADLLAYAVSLVGGESTAVANVVSASADLVLTIAQKGYALYVAIEAAKAPAPVAVAAPIAPAPAQV